MAIFVVTSNEESMVDVASAIEEALPGDSLSLGGSSWLVSHKGTARDVATVLGIGSEALRVGVVMQITPNYFGYADMQIWDWLKERFEASDGGK